MEKLLFGGKWDDDLDDDVDFEDEGGLDEFEEGESEFYKDEDEYDIDYDSDYRE
ncbi:MAG: hypothetical protein LBB59_02690 [Campylobacteraceae bacterium]|nr:hypothetical protein [Campylobacteraceae bacterium]